MHTITVSGATIRYWTYGDTTKPMVIFIHGFRGTHHGFEKIVEQLQLDFYCVVPDLPGFGESGAFEDREHSLKAYVEAVATFTRKLSAGLPCFIVGHSFGSIVVSHVAAKYPELFEKVALINPISSPALQGPNLIGTKLAQLYYAVAKILPSSWAHQLLSSPLIVDTVSRVMTITKDKEVRRYIFDQHRQHFSTFSSPKVVAEAFNTSVSHTTAEVATALTPPTLVIAAEKDQISSLQSQKEFTAKLPNGTLYVAGNVGHLIHYEKATEAAAAIRDFLRA